MAKLRKFTIEIFVYRIETLLEVFRGELANRIVCRIMIYVRQKNGLGERRTNVLSRTPVTVPISTNLFMKIR